MKLEIKYAMLITLFTAVVLIASASDERQHKEKNKEGAFMTNESGSSQNSADEGTS